VPELRWMTFNDAFARELDRVRVAQLMRRKTPAHARADRPAA
jgi:hypothetical protein